MNPAHLQWEPNLRYLDEIRRDVPCTPLQPSSVLEIRKAIGSLAARRAPGPDGLPTEVFSGLPALQEPLASLFTSLLQRGRLPQGMSPLYVIPLGNPGKSRTSCIAKRPISLLCAISKILEAVVFHRLPPLVEPRLNPNQLAYRM